jgi:hypothetical protein
LGTSGKRLTRDSREPGTSEAIFTGRGGLRIKHLLADEHKKKPSASIPKAWGELRH